MVNTRALDRDRFLAKVFHTCSVQESKSCPDGGSPLPG